MWCICNTFSTYAQRSIKVLFCLYWQTQPAREPTLFINLTFLNALLCPLGNGWFSSPSNHNVIWQDFMHFLLGVDSALTGYETQSRSDTTLLCEPITSVSPRSLTWFCFNTMNLKVLYALKATGDQHTISKAHCICQYIVDTANLTSKTTFRWPTGTTSLEMHWSMLYVTLQKKWLYY